MGNVVITVSQMTESNSRMLARDYRPGLWWVTFCARMSINYRSFGSQEDAEYFAAGVQAGLISAGLSATVEIVTVGEAADVA